MKRSFLIALGILIVSVNAYADPMIFNRIVPGRKTVSSAGTEVEIQTGYSQVHLTQNLDTVIGEA